MNILILHRMGNPRTWRHAVEELQLCLPKYAPQHNYLVHNALLPLPEFVKDLEFDGIVLGSTFLISRRYPNTYERVFREYDFIRDVDAFKIALPQDDYDCSALLDRWVVDWKIDKVYTVCPDHWEVLYPGLLRSGGDIVLGFTGYISRPLIRRSRGSKPHEQRPIDVCYRSKRQPLCFGRLGLAKSQIGSRFLDAFRDECLVTDISVDPKDTIPGQEWLDFIESSRFTLGANSGSSLLDPEGQIRQRVNEYLSENPQATFEEVEAACFPGQDGQHVFTAISPRVLEAGMLKTGQILAPGPYNGLLEPWVHYIPLPEDCSNKYEVAGAIKDPSLLKQITDACKERLMESPELMMETFASNIVHDVENGTRSRTSQLSDARFRRAVMRHGVNVAVSGGLMRRLGTAKRVVTRLLRSSAVSCRAKGS